MKQRGQRVLTLEAETSYLFALGHWICRATSCCLLGAPSEEHEVARAKSFDAQHGDAISLCALPNMPRQFMLLTRHTKWETCSGEGKEFWRLTRIRHISLRWVTWYAAPLHAVYSTHQISKKMHSKNLKKTSYLYYLVLLDRRRWWWRRHGRRGIRRQSQLLRGREFVQFPVQPVRGLPDREGLGQRFRPGAAPYRRAQTQRQLQTQVQVQYHREAAWNVNGRKMRPFRNNQTIKQSAPTLTRFALLWLLPTCCTSLFFVQLCSFYYLLYLFWGQKWSMQKNVDQCVCFFSFWKMSPAFIRDRSLSLFEYFYVGHFFRFHECCILLTFQTCIHAFFCLFSFSTIFFTGWFYLSIV